MRCKPKTRLAPHRAAYSGPSASRSSPLRGAAEAAALTRSPPRRLDPFLAASRPAAKGRTYSAELASRARGRGPECTQIDHQPTTGSTSSSSPRPSQTGLWGRRSPTVNSRRGGCTPSQILSGSRGGSIPTHMSGGTRSRLSILTDCAAFPEVRGLALSRCHRFRSSLLAQRTIPGGLIGMAITGMAWHLSPVRVNSSVTPAFPTRLRR